MIQQEIEETVPVEVDFQMLTSEARNKPCQIVVCQLESKISGKKSSCHLD